MRRRTIERPVSRTGLGISTGEQVTLSLDPAEPGNGLAIRRQDVRVDIPLHIEHAADAANCTAVRLGEHAVFVVEHLLATLWATGITDVRVSVDQEEVPIFDGSASAFLEMIEEAGVRDLAGHVEPIEVSEPVVLHEGHKLLAALPADRTTFYYYLEHPHRLIGRDHAVYAPDREAFGARLAGARTFVTEQEARQLIAAGLLRGGDEGNAVVAYQDRLSEPVAPGGFAAHKIVDLLGDLYLLNRPLVGLVVACRTGHAENRALARQLAELSAPPA